ncbi:hypothetical protein ACUXG3_006056 [Bacillus thuringiensis]
MENNRTEKIRANIEIMDQLGIKNKAQIKI